MKKKKFVSKEKISDIPETTGVYIFEERSPFYIGKAINLRKRIRSHFYNNSPKSKIFKEKTSKISFIETDSEIEALILESKLIKKHRPKYNVIWRDDKNYFYVGMTKEDFPRIFITHQKEKGSEYAGPFVNGKALKSTLKLLRKAFPFRSCKNLPQKPCLWYQIKRCPAPCLAKSNSEKKKMEKECRENAKNIMEIIRGKKGKIEKGLKKKMKRFSKNQEYEKSIKARDQIFSLEKIFLHSKILDKRKSVNWQKTKRMLQKTLGMKKDISRIEGYDISNIQGKSATGSMVVFEKGIPRKDLYRKFKIKNFEEPNDTAMMRELISRRFNHPEWKYPELILIDGGKGQLNESLKEKKKRKIKFISLAKKENNLFVEKREKPLFLKDLPEEISNLILNIRDESHRFAISYHRKLRSNSLMK
jgi:excinuclease ABC subunit C